MPRTPTHPPVPRINPAVVKEAFRKPSESESGYYILEKGKTLVCLRVRKTTVQIGVRHQSRWHPVAPLRAPRCPSRKSKTCAWQPSTSRASSRTERGFPLSPAGGP